MNPRKLLKLLVPAAILAAGAALAQPPQYSLTKIPNPSWQHYASGPSSMGEDGSVAMSNGSGLASYWRADVGTVLVDFPDMDYTGFSVDGNSNGMVVGGYQKRATGIRAGVWELGKGGRVLWDEKAIATNVNDRNEILAYGPRGVTYVYADGTERRILPPLGPVNSLRSRALSDTGYAAGVANVNGKQTDWISKPGGNAEAIWYPPGYSFADVIALDDNGTAYGNCFSPGSGSAPAFIRTIDGSWKLVKNTLWGDGRAELNFADVNSSGLISGSAYFGTHEGSALYHTILYREDLGLLDVNDLLDASGAGWELNGPGYINDKGQISTYGHDPTGKVYAVILNPVPEPASLLILTAGLGLLVRKRRART